MSPVWPTTSDHKLTGKQSITVRVEVGVRWQHCVNWSKVKTSADSCLQCHSNPKQRADRQKIQMNALFLPGLEKELMKRCSVCELLTSGNLGPFYRRRSPGVLHRQNQIADGDFMVRPYENFCHRAICTLLVFWTASRVSNLHRNQLFRSGAIRRVTQINTGLARGAEPLNKINLRQLRAGCQALDTIYTIVRAR